MPEAGGGHRVSLPRTPSAQLLWQGSFPGLRNGVEASAVQLPIAVKGTGDLSAEERQNPTSLPRIH